MTTFDDGGTDVFDAPSRWRAHIAESLGLSGLELRQALGAGPAYPSALTSALAAVPRGPDALVVDVGAGIGATSDLARQLTGASVIAVEPSPGSIDACRQLFPQIPVVAGSADALPIAERAASGLLLNGVVSLIDDLGAVLDEACRVLRPGGVVAITDLFLDVGEELHASPNVFRSMETVARELTARGCSIVEIGLGAPAPREDWAAPQAALDELTAETFGDEPGYQAFHEDQRHLAQLVGRSVLVGGCIAASRIPRR